MNSAKLVVAGANYFWDVSLHHQLTVEVNAEIANQLYWMDDQIF